MSRENLERLREDYASIEKVQGRIPNSREIERVTAERAEHIDREIRDQARINPAKKQAPNTTTYIDRYGNKMTVKE